MKNFSLIILYNTSVDSLSKRDQYYTKNVQAQGYSIIANGRVYEFWNKEGDTFETVATYPTNCTIIERVS